MNIHSVTQGTPEWHALRANHFTASEAPAMLGVSKYQTRAKLMQAKALGVTEEVNEATQALFNRGHEAEAMARPIAERILGEELFPATVSKEIDGLPLLASLDGMTMLGDSLFEHKLWNEKLAAQVRAGELDEHYTAQMEQCLMVTGASKVLFMTSDGTEENCEWMLYEPDAALSSRIVSGWKQFAEDLANHQHVEVIPAAVAAPIKDLPAIVVSVSGNLSVATNFAQWGVELNQFIERIPQKPTTDQEFADCKAAVTALKKAEEQLDAEEARVLGLVPSIDEMKREKKMLFDLSRTTRLALEKLVVARDAAVKNEIIQGGKDAADKHISNLNQRIGKPYMPTVPVDFAAAIKSKSKYENMRSAVSDTLAQFKIKANEIADKIEINLNTLRELAKDHAFLFADTAQLVMKANDDLIAVIKTRIAEHEAAEAQKRAAEEERIRAEERAKLEAEQKQQEVNTPITLSAETPAKCDGNHGAPRESEKVAPIQEPKKAPFVIAHRRGPDEIAVNMGGQVFALTNEEAATLRNFLDAALRNKEAA